MQTSYSTCARLAALAALAFSGAASSFAQTASLKGQVTDPSGASVPQAAVVLRKAPSTELRTTTNAQGSYVFNSIATGSWSLTITKPGFAPFQMQSFDVSGPSVADVRMEVALETQKVTVSDSNNQVSTDPNQNVGALVLRGEDLDTLSDDPDQLSQDLQALAGPAAGPNGGQIFIDGFSGGELPPKSSIREIRINQNPFSAEYDRLGFGRIEIFTKPGTDKFRGQLQTMVSDNIFNARNPFVQERPNYQSRFFSGSLSGPITKKASFSTDIERRDIDEYSIINATVLDPNLNPYHFTDSVLSPNARWHITQRLDFALNEKNTLTGRYSYTRTDNENSGVGNFALASRGYDVFGRNHTIQLTETAILSPKAINETRFQYSKRRNGDLGDTSVPSINVLDAFMGGGNQVGLAGSDQNSYEIQNITSINSGKHSLKFGARVRTSSTSDVSPQNFGGTFTFSGVRGVPVLDAGNNPVLDPSGAPVRTDISSIEQYRRTVLFEQQGLNIAQIRLLGGGASQFTMAGGDPLAGVSQTDVGIFALDDWRMKPNFTLSYGLRYETQTNISDLTNFSPRLSFAWGVGGGGNRTAKTVIRGGLGVFYDRVDDTLTLNARRSNGILQQSYIIPNPPFLTVPSLDMIEASRRPQNIRDLQSDIRAPYIMQTAVGVDRQLPKNTTISVNYTFSRGVHMLRTVSVPLTPDPTAEVFANNAYIYESTGTLRQHQIITNINSRFNRHFSLFGFYMLNWARGDTDGVSTFPAVRSNYALEYGPTRFDIRNRLFLGGSVNAPFGISLSPFITASSGMPYNVTTGIDNNGDSVYNDRPAFATDPNAPNVRNTPLGLFNLNPSPNDPIVPRNYGRGPGQFTINARLSKTWGFGKPREGNSGPGDFGGGDGDRGGRGPRGGGGGGGGPRGMSGGGGGRRGGGMFGGVSTGKRYNLTFSVSARNLLNHVNLTPPIGNLSSPLFGQSLSIAGGFGPEGASSAANRRIDLSLRFTF
jgi:hypothetical protein